MKTLFPAIVDRADDGTYGVVFPDVEGCSSGGETLEEAVRNAEDALAQHLEVMNENGMAMPTPSELAEIERPEDTAAIMLIPARVPERAVRINITIDRALLERIDDESKNRSAWLADAARERLARRSVTAGDEDFVAAGAIPVYQTKLVDKKTGVFTIDKNSLSSYVIVGEVFVDTVKLDARVVPGRRAGQRTIVKADPYPVHPAITYRVAASGRYVDKDPTHGSGRDVRHSAGSVLSQTSKPAKKK